MSVPVDVWRMRTKRIGSCVAPRWFPGPRCDHLHFVDIDFSQLVCFLVFQDFGLACAEVPTNLGQHPVLWLLRRCGSGTLVNRTKAASDGMLRVSAFRYCVASVGVRGVQRAASYFSHDLVVVRVSLTSAKFTSASYGEQFLWRFVLPCGPRT